MDNEIRRATGLLVIEVVNSNPNGDPDRESDPRQRPNGCGEISPVSFKRKLRDLLDDHDTPFFRSLPEQFRADADRYCILEHRGRDRKQITAEMGKEPEKFLQSEFVRKYWDARVFGNTFLEDGGNKGFIKTGVVQFGMGNKFIAYSKDETIYLYRFDNKKTYKLSGEYEKAQFMGVSDGKVIWMDVTSRERDILKYSEVPDR